MKTQGFIKGAVIVAVGGITAKILGAFYRIPLTNILGGTGMGIYQMVYPLYCLLLTVSATGIPSGLARLVSAAESSGRIEKSQGILKKSLLVFSIIGLIGSIIMFAIAPFMSYAQNEIRAVSAYRALAPGVFFVSVLSCFRGWFQGKSNFLPTAVSEICEQVVKIAFGLSFAGLYRSDVVVAVTYTLRAVTFSELAACVFMILYYKTVCNRRPLYREKQSELNVGAILRVTVPVTVAAGLLPLSNIADSILIVRLIGRYTSEATALYGLYAGAATTLIGLPISVCYGIAASVIPSVAALQSQGKVREAETKIVFALKCTLFLAFPAAAILFALSGEVAAFLFPSIVGAQGETLASLVRTMSLSTVLLSGVQTLSACLIGIGKSKRAAFSMTMAVLFKIASESILLLNPKISILGAAYASVGCYFVAILIDLLYSIKEIKNRLRIAAFSGKFLTMSVLASVVALAAARVHILLAVFTALTVYLIASVPFRAFRVDELQTVRRKKKHDNTYRVGMQSRRFIRRRSCGAEFGSNSFIAYRASSCGKNSRGKNSL